MTEEQIARFWSKVVKLGADECWPWTATPDQDGYGLLYIDGKNARAHRLAILLDGRKIPLGHVVDHTCRNRVCVNPNHLRVVTLGANTLENSQGLAAENKAKEKCIQGHELSGHNLWVKPDGKRRCRLCDNAWNRAYRARKKGNVDAQG